VRSVCDVSFQEQVGQLWDGQPLGISSPGGDRNARELGGRKELRYSSPYSLTAVRGRLLQLNI